MCMPQLQEGDEIVHINGRTVKDLPHHEVLVTFFLIYLFIYFIYLFIFIVIKIPSIGAVKLLHVE